MNAIQMTNSGTKSADPTRVSALAPSLDVWTARHRPRVPQWLGMALSSSGGGDSGSGDGGGGDGGDGGGGDGGGGDGGE